jgi:hypothetical protein
MVALAGAAPPAGVTTNDTCKEERHLSRTALNSGELSACVMGGCVARLLRTTGDIFNLAIVPKLFVPLFIPFWLLARHFFVAC